MLVVIVLFYKLAQSIGNTLQKRALISISIQEL